MKLQSVNGQVTNVVPYLVFTNKEEANQTAMQTLQYCTEQLGQPAAQRTGLFVWDAASGNVILQTNETHEERLVGRFLTSRSIRDLPESEHGLAHLPGAADADKHARD